MQRLEHEGDIAADYLEELLDIADLDGDLDMDVEGDRASVQIGGADLSQLVGRNGEVLEALQELTRLAVYRETGERSRLMLDVGGHRAEQRTRLVALAEKSIAEVKESGESLSLEPMSAVRAQGRPRRGGRGRPDLRVRGRGAEAPRGDPPGVSDDVSRETPSVPDAARGVFAVRPSRPGGPLHQRLRPRAPNLQTGFVLKPDGEKSSGRAPPACGRELPRPSRSAR